LKAGLASWVSRGPQPPDRPGAGDYRLPTMPQEHLTSSRRAATRQRLVEAALEVVARKGFPGASVDEIAHRAGFSVGALYSNFAGKDELFLAVFDAHLGWYRAQLDEARTQGDTLTALATMFGALGNNDEQFLVFLEFWAYAVRRPKLRAEFGQRMAELGQANTEALADLIGPDALPLGLEQSALLMIALGRGLAIERLARPELVSDKQAAALLIQAIS
jgi:AcrR family transcriptional regulator